MAKYVPLIIGAVFLLFILFGLFWGLIRGLKKSGFRAVWILVCAVILFFVTPLITKGVMNLNIEFLGIVIDEVSITTLNHLAEVLISNIPDYGELLTKNPETLELMLTLVSLFVNAFVYVITFWLVKIVLWPIWAILSAVFIKKKDAQGNKKPKHRLFGALVGGVAGVFVGATTLMPIMGVVNMASEVEAETYETYTKKVYNEETGLEEEQTFTGGQISQLLGEDVANYINVYNDSFVAKAFKYTGIEFLNNATYSGLSSATVNENRIVLKEEVKTGLKTVSSINTLSNLDFDNLTQEKVSKIISSAKTLVNNVFDMEIVNALGENLYPLVMDEILNNPEFVVKLPTTGKPVFDDAIVDAFTELKDIKFGSIKNELLAVLDVAELLNNNGIIVKLANNEDGTFQDVTMLVTTSVVEQVNEKLFSMQTTSGLMPIMVNASLNYIAESLEVEDFSVDEEKGNSEAVKKLFTGITNTIFAISNSLDLDSTYYVTETTLPLAGKLLNSVKDYEGLTSENYKKLVNAFEDKITTELTKALDGIQEELTGVKDEILKAVKNLSDINNFEDDFTKLSNVYSDMVTVLQGLSADETEIKLVEVGRVLDTIKQTQLFGNAITPIINSGLDYAKTKIPTEYSDLAEVINNVKNNVSSVTSWETELTKVKQIVDVAVKVFEADDFKSALLNEDSTLLAELGSALNSLNTSQLFNGEVKNVVKVLLNQVENVEIDNADMLSTTITQIKANIDSATNINWESEFTTLKTLLNSLMDLSDDSATSEAVTAVGKAFDEILETESVLITEDVVKTIICTTIDQFAGTVESGSDLEIIVTKIKSTINSASDLNYETELTALNSLFENITDIDTSSSNFYSEFGTLLDSYDVTYGYYHSVVVSSARTEIVTMAINKVDTSSMDSDMVAIINKIKNNVVNIESVDSATKYKTEFEHIKTFVDSVNNLTEVDVTTFNFGEFGTMLDGFNNSVLLKPVRSDVLTFVCNKAQSSLTTSITQLNTAITEILTQTKSLSVNAENQELTYNQIFTDLGKVKNLTDKLQSVEISRTDEGILTIKTFGETLTELDSLCVVPHIATVRIAEYITGEIVGDNGIKNIMPDGYEGNDTLLQVYNDVVSEITPINQKYANYLSNPDSTTFNFTSDFTSIWEVVKSADENLTTAGYARPTE